MQWLNNPWLVGIVGGVLSGIFVAFFTRKMFSKKDNKEYLQKLYSANRELIFALRPGVAEGVIPSRKVVMLVTNATARKYQVEPKDLFGADQVAEELVKEIMDSSFISSSTKEDYCNKLEALTKKSGEGYHAEIPDKVHEMYSERYRSKMTATLSMTLGMTTALFTFIWFFFDRKSIANDFAKDPSIFWYFAVPVGVSLLAVFTSTFYSVLEKVLLGKRGEVTKKRENMVIVQNTKRYKDSNSKEEAIKNS